MSPISKAWAALSGLLALLVVLAGGMVAGHLAGGWAYTPKLALDLEGGTQVILQASTSDGAPVTRDALNEAASVMSQRINAMGVSETEIAVQGSDKIVVSVPGKMSEETSQAIRQTALMQFRPVFMRSDPAPVDASQAGADLSSLPQDDPAEGTDPTDMSWVTQKVMEDFYAYDCTNADNLRDHGKDDAAKPAITCSQDGSVKYLLGPVAVQGKNIANASVSSEVTQTGQTLGTFQVNLTFDKTGSTAFSKVTTTLLTRSEPMNTFAITLDGTVLQAPTVQAAITNGKASITGGYTQDEADVLANQLKFGALPLTFDVQSEQQVSSSLGTQQLEKGLLAGLIGLALVVVYSVFQYRALSVVTTSALLASGGITYALLTLLSGIPDIGYRLSLAGIAGVIVSIGFTADSFIVYFERVRDEIRDGRGLASAIDHGWRRARRTILVSDAVNLIAAVVLYVLSVGSVRGFAFTLGLTTLVDLVVVFLFTHPVLRLLAQTEFFGGGHRLSGMDPRQYGRALPVYAGRGRTRSRRGRDEEEHLTIAERRRREALGPVKAAELDREENEETSPSAPATTDENGTEPRSGSKPGTADDGGADATESEEER